MQSNSELATKVNELEELNKKMKVYIDQDN